MDEMLRCSSFDWCRFTLHADLKRVSNIRSFPLSSRRMMSLSGTPHELAASVAAAAVAAVQGGQTVTQQDLENLKRDIMSEVRREIQRAKNDIISGKANTYLKLLNVHYVQFMKVSADVHDVQNIFLKM